ncbi:hypothetical protein Tco_0480356 [Tanacetum coccineum]
MDEKPLVILIIYHTSKLIESPFPSRVKSREKDDEDERTSFHLQADSYQSTFPRSHDPHSEGSQDHDGKWVEAEEDGDLNEVQAHQTTRARVEGITRTPRIRLPPGKQLTPNSHVLRIIHHRESQASEVLKNHMGSIAWSIAYIKGFDLSFSTHKILMEDEFKPSVQPQRRVNPNIKEVVKKEVIKLLDARLSYPISDSPWVRPVQVVPKKGGMTVVKNEKNELIPQRTVIGWRVCINYRKLNNVTRKDHFPLPFIDQMLECLAGHEYYFFLDGFLGYFQIPIAPEDQ